MSGPRRESQRLFRSAFPLAEMEDFRTASWSDGAEETSKVAPIFPTTLHALVSAAGLAGENGINLVDDEDGESETHRSYADILAAARRAAARLKGEGVRRGDRVLIVLPTCFEFVEIFCAVQMVGAIPVPVYPPMLMEKLAPTLERMGKIANQAETAWCVANRKLVYLVADLVRRVPSLRVVLTVEEIIRPADEASHAVEPVTSDIALIQYTSGSTGNPKGVALTHANLVANLHAMGQRMHISRRDAAVSWLPLYHDMGLIGALLLAIYWRFPLTLMSPLTFLQQPASWLWAIHRHQATLSGAPNFAYGRCAARLRDRQLEGLDLSSWRSAFNGAEPVNLRTVRDFIERFEPYGFKRQAMLPVYGLAESCLAVCFPRLNRPLLHEVVDREALAGGRVVERQGKGSTALVAVGRAMPGHAVLVVNDDGQELPEREVGHVIVRGPSVMSGYFNNPEATASLIRDGWLWTGDLGYFSNRHLYIVGRAKDLIILRGRNYYADDIERIVERVEGARKGCVAAFGVYDDELASDRVVIVVETRLTDAAERERLIAQVRERVMEHGGVAVDEVALVLPGTIPKTPSGKRQRGLCREMWLKDELEPPSLGPLGAAGTFIGSLIGMSTSRLRRVFRDKGEAQRGL